LEDKYINLNQGAESTVSYLMARLKMEKHFNTTVKESIQKMLFQQRTIYREVISISM